MQSSSYPYEGGGMSTFTSNFRLATLTCLLLSAVLVGGSGGLHDTDTVSYYYICRHRYRYIINTNLRVM
jgi:hypothetical protein